MILPLDRLVFAPGVALVAATQIIPAGFEEAIELSSITEAAETPGTPLNELAARIYGREPGDHRGHGDDIAEFSGRQCYRSWSKGRPQSEYISNVINECHGSIFRHANVLFQLTGVSRSLSHEQVRHGVGAAPSQESQRYVDAKHINFVVPPITANELIGASDEEIANHPEIAYLRKSFGRALEEYAEYQVMLKARLKALYDAGDYKGATSYIKRANEAARAILPNAAETRLTYSMNLQAARHILALRGTEYADLEIRRMAAVILDKVRDYAPHFFAEVTKVTGQDGLPSISALNGKL